MKEKYHSAFLDMAIRFGQTSEANRLKVGALLVRDGKILSQGVNGNPPKWESEVCEGEDGKTLPHVRHAEVACLEKLWNSTETASGATMYISHSPCLPCAIKLLTAGVSSVYFKEFYRCDDGVKFLKRHGVEVKQLSDKENERLNEMGDCGCVCNHSNITNNLPERDQSYWDEAARGAINNGSLFGERGRFYREKQELDREWESHHP